MVLILFYFWVILFPKGVIVLSIGKNIKRLRESHGMSQSDLAFIAGVTDKAVSTWENNLKTPRMGSIQKIADYFNISKSDIIEDTLGDRISACRIKMGMSQIALSERTGIDLRYIERYEADVGIPSPAFIKRIADVLEVDVLFLLGDKQSSTEEKKSPAPEGTEDEAKREKSYRLFDSLVSAGLIRNDDLAADDIDFLFHVLDIIDDWFARKERQ